jgi:precorrin-2 dehydrogenase/sirohydrochlorin ferrochelatase
MFVMTNHISMIPLMLDLAGKRVVIFGGGGVGLRKARYFRPGAAVEVVSRSFLPGFGEMGIACRTMDLETASDEEIADCIRGCFLVVAATSSPGLNDRIGTICRNQAVLFNNAEGTPGDVIVPSVVRGEHYILAVSTGGKSPAVPRYLRMMIQRECGDLDGMIELQNELRDRLKESEPSQETRAKVLWDLLNDREIWEELSRSRATAREMAVRKYLS